MKKILILHSGGIDSTACIKYFLNAHLKPNSLFIDYGQKSAEREYKASKAITEHYAIPYKRIIIQNNFKSNGGLIIGRNAMLLTMGLLNFNFNNGLIAIGAHNGTNYVDCNPPFIDKMQQIFDEYTNGKIQISAPFLKFRKEEILQFCQENDVPLSLTYSCELGKKQPCGKCKSCEDLGKYYGSTKQNY